MDLKQLKDVVNAHSKEARHLRKKLVLLRELPDYVDKPLHIASTELELSTKVSLLNSASYQLRKFRGRTQLPTEDKWLYSHIRKHPDFKAKVMAAAKAHAAKLYPDDGDNPTDEDVQELIRENAKAPPNQ